MAYLTDAFSNLIHRSTFFFIAFGSLTMTAVALLFLYLTIVRGFEPLLLVPIMLDILLVNIYPDTMLDPAGPADGSGGFLHYFYQLNEQKILSPLIFTSVGAMTDFGPLITNPISFLLDAAAQSDVHAAYLLVVLLGFNGKVATAISIISGADGSTSTFLANKMGQNEYLDAIAVAAYSYMSLVPIIQSPIMCLLTTEKEHKVRMAQLRPVPRLEKIFFPIVVTVTVSLLLPTIAPLVGMLMLGSLFREPSVMRQLTDTVNSALVYIVVILLDISVGAAASAEALLKADALKIILLGLVAFAFGTVAGVLLSKLMCKLTGGKVNSPIGSAGVSTVPMSARVSRKAGAEADLTSFLLMHAMGPNVTGVISTAVAAGTFMAIFGMKQAQHETIFRVRQAQGKYR